MRRHEVVGWTLFVLCAITYLAAGVRDGDALVVVGSAIFLGACVVFLLPVVRDRDGR